MERIYTSITLQTAKNAKARAEMRLRELTGDHAQEVIECVAEIAEFNSIIKEHEERTKKEQTQGAY